MRALWIVAWLLAAIAPASAQFSMMVQGPAGTTYSTFNPAVNASESTYSNGNNTWSCPGCTTPTNAAFNTYGTKSHSSGQYFFELTATSATNSCCYQIGIANSSIPSTALLGDNNNDGIGYNAAGQVNINNAVASTIATFANGNTICVAVDLATKLIWYRVGSGGNWNNNATYNPAVGTETGGISISGTSSLVLFPAVSTFGGAGTTTLNTGGSAFSACPSSITGYSKWQ